MNANKSLEDLQSALDEFRGMAIFEGYELVCPESPGMDEDTPLHVAAMDGRIDLLNKMLPFAKNINVLGDLGNTPLHCAVLWNQLDVVLLLLSKGAAVGIENDYGDTAFNLMKVRLGFEEIVKELEIPGRGNGID